MKLDEEEETELSLMGDRFLLRGNGEHVLRVDAACNATLSVVTSYFIDVPANENSTLKMEFLNPNPMQAKEGTILQQEVRVTNHGEAMGMVTAVVG